MKARTITINPFAKLVDVIVIDVSDGAGLKGIYAAIRSPAAGTDLAITSVRVQNGADGRRHVIYLDDLGLYRDKRLQRFFDYRGYPQTLAGSAIIVGIGPEGETIDCNLSLAEVRGLVTWPAVEFAGMTEPVQTEIDHPILGRMTQISSKATFKPRRGR